MENIFNLNGKTLFITGASSGIGRAVAIQCSIAGAKLIITGRNEERLRATFSNLAGENHQLLICDITEESAINKLVEGLPKLDGVVHCAGIIKPFPVKLITKDQIDEVQKINYDAPVLLTSALFKLKKMHKNASIIFLSSVAGNFPYKGGALYASSKVALTAFAKTVALEYGHQGIRSNCISAGIVETPLLDNAQNEYLENVKQFYPLGFGKPSDVASAIVFLLSDASKWITGTSLVIDGGFSCRG